MHYLYRSEIAISPFILPDNPEPEHSSSRKPSASSSSPPQERLQPPSIRPFSLFENDKLVIPQKPLYAVFSYAVKLLASYSRNDVQTIFEHLSDSTTSSPSKKVGKSANLDSNRQRELDSLSKCILIQNPEHGKALNIRKRMLSHNIKEDTTSLHIFEVIQAELDFTKLILGIASNAKMGSLWHHRKWLYSLKYRIHESKGDNTPLPEHQSAKRLLRIYPVPISPIEVQQELALIDMCAERYPRNYQAWSYRYWLVRGHMLALSTRCTVDGESYAQSPEDGSGLLLRDYDNMESHLSAHIGDHTAAMHMLNILCLATQRDHAWQQNLGGLLERAHLFALDLVRRYPYKETPWLLLRGVLALTSGREKQGGLQGGIARNKHIQEAILAASSLQDRGRALQDTRAQYNEGEEDWERRQATATDKYASRMLIWLSCFESEVGAGFSGLSSSEARSVLERFR